MAPSEDVMVYGFGYWGWGNRVPQLHAECFQENLNRRGRAIKWIDARIRRNVRARGFNGRTAETLLGSKNYRWVREFGNETILVKQPGVRIRDFDAGFSALLEEIVLAKGEHRDLIIFCSCKNPLDCHRTPLLEMIRLRLEKADRADVHVFGEFPR